MTKVKYQCIENLPDELLTQKRFFLVGTGNDLKKRKIPAQGEHWQDVNHLKYHYDVKLTKPYQSKGLNIVDLTGGGKDYLCVDFDHVLDDNGNFTNKEAEKWVNLILSETPTYAEYSTSKHGLHFLFRPTNKAEIAQYEGYKNLVFTYNEEGKPYTQIEMFYRTNGRYIYFTGDVYKCKPKTEISTDTSVAELIWQEIDNRDKKKQKTATQKNNAQTKLYQTPKQYDLDRALAMLDKIPCAEQTYSDWITIGMVLKRNGNGIEDWINWSATDKARFKDDSECNYKWKDFNKGYFETHGVTIATLHKFAKTLYGYDEYNFRRQWYKDNGGFSAGEDFGNEYTDAVIALKELLPDDITREKLRSKKFLRQIALCYEFDKAEIADNIIDIAVDKKIPSITRRGLEREIDRIRTEIKREVKEAKQLELLKIKDAKLARLAELKKMQPSEERNAQMISLIKDCCEWSIDPFTHQKSRIKATQKNANLIFTYDPMLDGLAGYNEFSNRNVLLKYPHWKADLADYPKWQKNYSDDCWEDIDDDNLAVYLRETYEEFHNEKIVSQTFNTFAYRNKFNPLKKYLENLQWDGVKRAETIFSDFLGVDDTPYSRAVTLNWLVGAIARVYYPGCAFQYALVLQGAQGIGKSLMLERLGGKWYSTISASLDDSHAQDVLQSSWIVEFGEWASGRKTEINAQKNFLSSGGDRRRKAYDRRETDNPRKCVFSITVNDDSFLRDATGNRRFKVLECKNTSKDSYKVIREFNAEYVNQIWAEVFEHFKELFAEGFDSEKLLLEREYDEQAEEIAKQFVFDDGLTTEIQSFVDTKIPKQPIWLLMTKTERKQFFEQGNINFDKKDLQCRIDTLPSVWKNDIQFRKDFENALKDGTEKVIGMETRIIFYGKEYRQHISAGEIYVECFGMDRRKSMVRIGEILGKLEGWQVGRRLRNADPKYTDQKKPYYRITPIIDEEIVQGEFDEEFTGEVIPEEKIPF